jgi:hypothetical protein
LWGGLSSPPVAGWKACATSANIPECTSLVPYFTVRNLVLLVPRLLLGNPYLRGSAQTSGLRLILRPDLDQLRQSLSLSFPGGAWERGKCGDQYIGVNIGSLHVLPAHHGACEPLRAPLPPKEGADHRLWRVSASSAISCPTSCEERTRLLPTVNLLWSFGCPSVLFRVEV